MAAGYDKNAEVPDALLGLGFGFAEVGTVTPLPQPGNPKPRIFRLTADQAVINRLGFNNEGHERAYERLRARAGRGGIVGVNIGANKDSADRIADYEAGVRRFARCRVLSDRQHLVAQHAGPARHAGAPGAGRTCWRASWRRGRDALAGRQRAGVPQDRARPRRGRARRHRRRGSGEQGRRRHRLQHDARPAPTCAAARIATRRAACRGGRCSSARPRSWRACGGCSGQMSP